MIVDLIRLTFSGLADLVVKYLETHPAEVTEVIVGFLRKILSTLPSDHPTAQTIKSEFGA